MTSGTLGRILLSLGFGLLTLTWAMSTPADGFPDELDHYVRSLAVAHGELHGAPDPKLTPKVEASALPKSCCLPGNPTATVWVLRGARIVEIPARLGPEHWRCEDVHRGRVGLPCEGASDFPSSGRALHLTSMGTIEPLPYVLPGLAAHLGSGPGAALRWARVANVVVASLLLAAAVWALWPRTGDRAASSITGLLVAVSPMVLFIAASPSPSAVEVASAVAFIALLLRVVRPDPSSRRTWVLLGLSGLLLATSRSLGPVWVALDALAALALAGWSTTWGRVREGGRWAALAIGVTVAGGVSTVLWEATAQPGVPFDDDFFWKQIGPAWRHLPETSREVVGIFGWLDVRMSSGAYVTWAVAAGALLLVALVVGRWRDRLLALGVVAVPVLAALVVSAAVLRQNGFDLQGRHVLGLAVAAPLVLGEVVSRRAASLPRWLGPAALVLVMVTTVAVQLAALSTSGEHYGLLGRGHPGPDWTPPGGTALWVVLGVAGAFSVAAGAMLALVGRQAATSATVPDAQRP